MFIFEGQNNHSCGYQIVHVKSAFSTKPVRKVINIFVGDLFFNSDRVAPVLWPASYLIFLKQY